jgi:hypothetical protein
MEEFLWQNGIAFKHYGDYLKQTSERVRKASTRPYREASLPVIYLREAGVDKDAYARRVAAEHGITRGAACVLSVVEPCPTFEYVKSRMCGESGRVMCYITTAAMSSWAGCTRAFRPGFRSTFRSHQPTGMAGLPNAAAGDQL